MNGTTATAAGPVAVRRREVVAGSDGPLAVARPLAAAVTSVRRP